MNLCINNPVYKFIVNKVILLLKHFNLLVIQIKFLSIQHQYMQWMLDRTDK